MHRPLAAVVATLGVGSGVIFACSDDNDAAAGSTDCSTTVIYVYGPDGGTGTTPGTETPDTGTPDAETPDAGPAEYTVDIGAGFGTACALSNLGRVQCWGDAFHGDMLWQDLDDKVCDDLLAGEPQECNYLAPTVLAIPYPVEQLAVGDQNVCVIANDDGERKLGCWGDAKDGMRFSAYGPLAPPPPPPHTARPTVKVTYIVWIKLPAEPKRISAEDYFMVTELVDGTLYAWGDNQAGQYAGELLEAEQGQPEKVWPATAGDALDAGPILDMTTGFGTTFVVTANGLYGTGSNLLSQQMLPYPVLEDFPEDGELLYNHTWKKLPDARHGVDGGALVEAAGSDPIAKLSKSNGLTSTGCYLTVSGKAYCWGSNYSGQIGSAAVDSGITSGQVNVAQVPTQVDLPAGRTATQIRVAERACAITDDGAVYCWGDNTNGYGAHPPAGGIYLTPQLVPGVSDVKVIAVGGRFFACALSGNHKTYCWGNNDYGQLGTDPGDAGASQFGNTPIEVPITW